MEDNLNKTREDFKWLLSSIPAAPSVAHLEATIQAFALLLTQSDRHDAWEPKDYIKVALSGFLANRARVLDEERFTNIMPSTYYQVAQYLMERDYKMIEDTEEEFEKFLNTIKL